MADKDSDRQPSLLRQVAPAVVIALLVGTSSPWWLKFFQNQDGGSGAEPPSKSQTAATHGTEKSSSGRSTPPAGAEVPSPTEGAPTSDFPSGSRPVYGADFSKWPTQTNEHGVADAAYGEYILEPNSNTWVSPGRLIDIQPLDRDFVVDVIFRIEQRDAGSSFQLQLYGPGAVTNFVQVILEAWNGHGSTYSLQTGTLQGNLYARTSQEIASREPLPALLSTADWSKASKLTLRRDGGTAHLFVNDVLVRSFPVVVFTVSRIGVGAAFKSRIAISSIEARVPLE